MTREYDDLYARHQMLAALVNVLVHDLRNPLHSATLLVEAMGSPSANIETLRGKLRAQFGKLDGLIGETNANVKDLALEPNVEATALDSWLRGLADHFSSVTERQASFVLPPASDVEIAIDRKLLERAAIEVAAALIERQGQPNDTSPPRVNIAVDEPEPGSMRVSLGDLGREQGDALAKAPFAIAGGGIRLAMARSLAQSAGAMLRFEQDAEGTGRFAFFLRKAD
jgi:hypothetical protein